MRSPRSLQWLANSGITTVQSGIPIRLRFTGDIATARQALAWYGSDAFNGTNAAASLGAVTPLYLGNPQVGGTELRRQGPMI